MYKFINSYILSPFVYPHSELTRTGLVPFIVTVILCLYFLFVIFYYSLNKFLWNGDYSDSTRANSYAYMQSSFFLFISMIFTLQISMIIFGLSGLFTYWAIKRSDGEFQFAKAHGIEKKLEPDYKKNLFKVMDPKDYKAKYFNQFVDQNFLIFARTKFKKIYYIHGIIYLMIYATLSILKAIL